MTEKKGRRQRTRKEEEKDKEEETVPEATSSQRLRPHKESKFANDLYILERKTRPRRTPEARKMRVLERSPAKAQHNGTQGRGAGYN